jgi:hypothetical protein
MFVESYASSRIKAPMAPRVAVPDDQDAPTGQAIEEAAQPDPPQSSVVRPRGSRVALASENAPGPAGYEAGLGGALEG